MNPLVSVIVPIYNVEKYLPKCIESIINQTLKNIEIILVNDGSTDGCEHIIDNYAKKDKRIKAIHKKNEGQGSARNIGIQHSTGNYIGFVDGDDWIDLDMYKKLTKEIFVHDIDLVVCSRKVFNDDKQLINCIEVENELFEINDIAEHINYLRNKFFYPYTLSSCNKIYKANVIKENNIHFRETSEVGSEDALFNYNFLLYAKKIMGTGDTNYNQLAREGSTMRSYSKTYYMNKLANLLSYIQDLNQEKFNNQQNSTIKLLFYLHFFQRYSELILKYGGDKGFILLSDEYKLGMDRLIIKQCNIQLLFSHNCFFYQLGYRKKGIFYIKFKVLLLALGFYQIRARLK